MKGLGAQLPASQRSPRMECQRASYLHRLPPEPLIIRRKATRSVDLSHFGMGNSRTLMLSRGLAVLPDVDTVDLRNNRLTDGGVARMVRAAFDNRNVTSLDFSENQVSVEASAAIAHMLAVNPGTEQRSANTEERRRLTHLTLSRTKLDKRGMQRLRAGLESPQCRLTHLDLSNNKLGDLTGVVLGKLLGMHGTCRLETLNLEWNSIRKVSIVGSVWEATCALTRALVALAVRSAVHCGRFGRKPFSAQTEHVVELVWRRRRVRFRYRSS